MEAETSIVRDGDVVVKACLKEHQEGAPAASLEPSTESSCTSSAGGAAGEAAGETGGEAARVLEKQL
jgi:hypothetical protein